MWGIFTAMINSLNNSIHPKYINTEKFSEDGVWIPSGGVVNNDHMYRSPLTPCNDSLVAFYI